MNNSPKKTEKCTQKEAAQLEEIRTAMRFDKRGMAQILGLPYRTYQDYAYGDRPVPVSVLVMAKEKQKADKALIRSIKKNLERTLDRQYPQGIPSEVEF